MRHRFVFLIPRQNCLAILLKGLSSLTSGVARDKLFSLRVFLLYVTYIFYAYLGVFCATVRMYCTYICSRGY